MNSPLRNKLDVVELIQLRSRHAAMNTQFVKLQAEHAETHQLAEDQSAWIIRLVAENDDLRAKHAELREFFEPHGTKLFDEVNALRAENEELRAELAGIRTLRDALRTENAGLHRLLKFAEKVTDVQDVAITLISERDASVAERQALEPFWIAVVAGSCCCCGDTA